MCLNDNAHGIVGRIRDIIFKSIWSIHVNGK